LRELAILSGMPPEMQLPVSQPTLPPFEEYAVLMKEIFASRMLTNDRWVRELEAQAAAYIGCREVVALANATSGLVLVPKVLGLTGEACLPTFTFPATLHAILWNGMKPRLVDSDPETFNIDPSALEAALTSGAKTVLPVYIFGNSPDWARLTPLIEKRDLVFISDAAHALGSRWEGRMAGMFGKAEIFSLAPTKVTVAGEGGLVATNDQALARELRIARNYGNPGNYDCVIAGLNARLSEFHALLAHLCLARTEEAVDRRHALVSRYRSALEGLPGCSFQKIDPRCRSTYNYFAVLIESDRFGLTNAELHDALEAEGIQSKIYFAPPLHRQTRFTHLFEGQGPFPGAEQVLSRVLCLPLYQHMEDAVVDRIVEIVRACHARAGEVREATRRKRIGRSVEEVVSSVLGRPVDRAKAGALDLRDLGLGSLRMIQLLSELEERFSIKVRDEQVTGENFGTLDRLVRFVEAQAGKGKP
jgi:dTDP-4-amino-4,6-dideoxygalactose transaminase/acyl carrier protein